MNKNNKVKEACECKDKKKESNSDSSMDDIEQRRQRVETIQELLSDVHYKTQEVKDANILTLTKSALSLGEIAALVKPLKPGYLSSKDEQVHRKGVF